MEQNERGSPRLRFSKEELENPELVKPIRKAEKAAAKYEKTQGKLKTKRSLKLTREEIVQESKAESPVSDAPAVEAIPAEDAPVADPSAPAVLNTRKKPTARQEVTPAKAVSAPTVRKTEPAKAADPVHEIKKKTVQLKFEETKTKPPSKIHHPVTHTVSTELHRTTASANKDDNVAVSASLEGEKAGESALQMGDHAYHAHKLRTYRKAENAEKKLDKANIHYLQAKQQSENPQFSSNPYSRWQQKRAIKKEYAAAKAGKGAKAGSSAGSTAKQSAEKATDTAGKAVKTVIDKIKENPKAILICMLGAMLLIVMSAVQSCTPLAQSVLESIVIGTYPAEEDDVRAAERAYAAKEKELQDEIKNYERYHPGYDEYNVDADEIWHDPYVLIAIISAYYDGADWDIDKAYPVIEKYFELQYELTETVETEIRYKDEQRTGTYTITDPDTGATHTERYEYTASVPYTYTICNVTLENKDLSHLPVVSMSHHTMGMYALYMATHGNMEGIFRGGHASTLRDPTLYDIPQETLDANPVFATLMEEANKYIGYPYVWGGASPETSFDCSGFVSYVYTNTGVYNTGRLGAKGLYSLCRKVSEDEVQPGDLVFFEGTMGDDAAGVTHVGIYVGNHMMIHCGSPIGYQDLNDSYYKKHFLDYGRIPY